MKFISLQAVCKFHRFARDIDGYVVDACGLNVPSGQSWGECDKEHCLLCDKPKKTERKDDDNV